MRSYQPESNDAVGIIIVFCVCAECEVSEGVREGVSEGGNEAGSGMMNFLVGVNHYLLQNGCLFDPLFFLSIFL